MSNGPSLDLSLDMHKAMLRIRRIEEMISKRYAEQEIRCPTHLCIGQEAVPVGVSAHLRPDDYAFSGHRSHGHYLAKGGDLKAMYAELYGRETGCALGRGGSQHLIDLDAGFVASAPILAGTVPIAVGAAFGKRRAKSDAVSVVYFGDGATEEGAFHEALNFASVHKLPVLFICENNLYSVHSDLSVRQPTDRPVSALGAAHGMPGITADGNDIVEIWRLAGEAVTRARRGDGPTLIEFMTYRWLEHCGPGGDINLQYRTQEELSDWQTRDPLARSERALRDAGALNDAALQAIEAAISSEVDAAVDFARASDFPDPADIGQFTFPDAGARHA
ncbi:MAG TPA: thiamine pyrophosphate-dependent dehydrogenase E1 component subunit alpha [Alphaproteobacteria bacterium]|nr:thiamine pyrophosphate-dependent dehydrogenase E1 component subunit alpha [Alphaproteobacteria bacterium]